MVAVARDEVARGDVIIADGESAPSYRVDAALTWTDRPDGSARVGVHHGTRESAARLVELGGRFFQLRLEEPIVPLRGDRLVIRSLAPPDTIGGGTRKCTEAYLEHLDGEHVTLRRGDERILRRRSP